MHLDSFTGVDDHLDRKRDLSMKDGGSETHSGTDAQWGGQGRE